MTAGHAFLAPSSASIWGAPDGCRGYPTMASAYPEEDTDSSADGSRAHAHVDAVLKGSGTIPADTPDDMADAILCYVDAIRQLSQGMGGALIEVKLDMSNVSPGMFGTADYVAFQPTACVIADLKYGMGIVEVYENWQLLCYAAGVALKAPEMQQFTLVIIQPRAYHPNGPVRKWTITRAQLDVYIAALKTAAAECLADAPCRSGAHCRYCEARHVCTAAIDAGVTLYESTADILPVDLTPEMLAARFAVVSRGISQLEYLKTAYEAQIKNLLQTGHTVPGYELTHGRGSVVWETDTEAVRAVATTYKVDVSKPGLLTPKQAIKAGVPESVVNMLSKRLSGAAKIQPVDNRKAMEVFK